MIQQSTVWTFFIVEARKNPTYTLEIYIGTPFAILGAPFIGFQPAYSDKA